jgi:hypothetical protein
MAYLTQEIRGTDSGAARAAKIDTWCDFVRLGKLASALRRGETAQGKHEKQSLLPSSFNGAKAHYRPE